MFGGRQFGRVRDGIRYGRVRDIFYWGLLTKPRIAANGAHDPNEKIPEPYALFYIFSTNQPFVAFRGCRYVLADRHPNRCRTLRKYPRIITYHSISMPYGPNLTHKFAIPQVCLYHVYVPTVHSCPNELYNIHGDTHATNRVIRARAV